MRGWIGEKMRTIIRFLPALLVAEDSPTFMAVRAMFGLILIVLVVYVNCYAAISLRYCPLYGEGVQSVRAETVK